MWVTSTSQPAIIDGCWKQEFLFLPSILQLKSKHYYQGYYFASRSSQRFLVTEEVVVSAFSSPVTIVDRKASRIVQFSQFSVKEFSTLDRLAMAEGYLSFYHIVPNQHIQSLHILTLTSSFNSTTGWVQTGEMAIATLPHMLPGTGPTIPSLETYQPEHTFRNQEVMEHLLDPDQPHFST